MTVATSATKADPFDLDNFDQWFSTFDKTKDSVNDPWLSDSPNPAKGTLKSSKKGTKGVKGTAEGKKRTFGKPDKSATTSKSAKTKQTGLRIYDSSDDDDDVYSSDGSSTSDGDLGKNRRGRRSDPTNYKPAELTRNVSGALEKIMFATSQQQDTDKVNSKAKKKDQRTTVGDKSVSKKKTTKTDKSKKSKKSSAEADKAPTQNRAIQLLREVDMQRAKEAQARRRSSKEASQQRKSSVTASLGKFLDAVKADIDEDDEDVMECRSRATTGQIDKKSTKDKRGKALIRSRSVDVSERDLTRLFKSKNNTTTKDSQESSSSTAPTKDSEESSSSTAPTEATSFTSRSSNCDVSTSTEDDGGIGDPKRVPRRSTREAHRASKTDDEQTGSRSRSRSTIVNPSTRSRSSSVVGTARIHRDRPRRQVSDPSGQTDHDRDRIGLSLHSSTATSTNDSCSAEDVLDRIRSLSASQHGSTTARRHGALTAGRKKRGDLLCQSEHVAATTSRRPGSLGVERRDPLASRSSHWKMASTTAEARRRMYARSSSLKSLRSDHDEESTSGSIGSMPAARRRGRRESGLSSSVHHGGNRDQQVDHSVNGSPRRHNRGTVARRGSMQ